MNYIRFARKTYEKFSGMTPPFRATLLQVFTIPTLEELSEAFIEYETTYIEHHEKIHFHLKKNWSYLCLLFRAENGLVFTDLRPWGLERLKYYRDRMGQEFKVVVPFDPPTVETLYNQTYESLSEEQIDFNQTNPFIY